MKRTYTDEELISELHRFHRENGRVPTQLDMQPKFGYPSFGAYQSHFRTFNNGIKVANLIPNHLKYHPKLDGSETCTYCGKKANEIHKFIQWTYPNGVRYCHQHGAHGTPDYVKGNLDINSNTGLGRAGEILVIKTLEIGKEHDCNRESCNYPIDMYHKDYGRIDVKTALFSYERNSWVFNFPNKLEIKTFICVGLSSDRSTVEHVWIVPNEGEIRNKDIIAIYDTLYSLSTHEHWEVLSKPYNDVWQTMKLKTCNSMTDKSEIIN